MQSWKKFKTYKQRGEWVELQFMASAALRGHRVLKPWGDNLQYDVAIEHHGGLTRVQIKCTSLRKGGGYLCRLRHGSHGEQGYNPDEVDLFAVHVLPAKAWYLIPTEVVFTPTPKIHLTFYPHHFPHPGRHDHDHNFEPYREAWGLLTKSRRQFAHAPNPR
jgi:hypothetical protein